MNINGIINDQNLKPYFLDFVSKNFMWDLSELFDAKYSDKIKAQKEFYESLYILLERLKPQVPEEKLKLIIQEVSEYYISEYKLKWTRR